MRTLLLIDGNNQSWRAFHKYKGLRHGKHKVSLVFGMPSIINGLINKFKPSKTIITWDGNKSKHRLDILPDYKGKRKFRPDFDDWFKQKGIVQNLFYYLGIPQVHNENMEADDYIYMLSKMYRKQGYKIIIVSADKDFKQLINKEVSVYDGKFLFTKKNLKEVFGYSANQIVDYLTLLGDTSDNIPGYRGIGEKKCKDFLGKYGSIQSFLQSSDEYNLINKETLLQLSIKNTNLIDLRYFYKTYLKGRINVTYLRGKREPKLNKRILFKFCRRLNIKTFIQPAFLKNYE